MHASPDDRGPQHPLVAAANENFVESMKILVHHVAGGECREENGVFRFATGLPIDLFNGCMVVEPAEPEALQDAVAWVQARKAPFGVWIDERAAPEAHVGAELAGLQRRPAPYPGMAMRPIPEAPVAPPNVTVRAVKDDALSAYYAVQEAGGAPPELARRAVPRALAGDERVRVFVSEIDGRPVGNAVAIRTGNTVGIYAVGTAPQARNRGAGRTATWACLEAGRAWGCDVAVLQSSAMAARMYGRMGFEHVVPYAVYLPPSPNAS